MLAKLACCEAKLQASWQKYNIGGASLLRS